MLHLSPFLSFLPFLLTSTFFTPTHSDHEREQNVRERERERELLYGRREERRKRGFWKVPSSQHQRLRSTIIRGPMKLKFCREVHNT
jgi:hypothetical protein